MSNTRLRNVVNKIRYQITPVPVDAVVEKQIAAEAIEQIKKLVSIKRMKQTVVITNINDQAILEIKALGLDASIPSEKLILDAINKYTTYNYFNEREKYLQLIATLEPLVVENSKLNDLLKILILVAKTERDRTYGFALQLATANQLATFTMEEACEEQLALVAKESAVLEQLEEERSNLYAYAKAEAEASSQEIYMPKLKIANTAYLHTIEEEYQNQINLVNIAKKTLEIRLQKIKQLTDLSETLKHQIRYLLLDKATILALTAAGKKLGVYIPADFKYSGKANIRFQASVMRAAIKKVESAKEEREAAELKAAADLEASLTNSPTDLVTVDIDGTPVNTVDDTQVIIAATTPAPVTPTFIPPTINTSNRFLRMVRDEDATPNSIHFDIPSRPASFFQRNRVTLIALALGVIAGTLVSVFFPPVITLVAGLLFNTAATATLATQAGLISAAVVTGAVTLASAATGFIIDCFRAPRRQTQVRPSVRHDDEETNSAVDSPAASENDDYSSVATTIHTPTNISRNESEAFVAEEYPDIDNTTGWTSDLDRHVAPVEPLLTKRTDVAAAKKLSDVNVDDKAAPTPTSTNTTALVNDLFKMQKYSAAIAKSKIRTNKKLPVNLMNGSENLGLATSRNTLASQLARQNRQRRAQQLHSTNTNTSGRSIKIK